jgi:hypothetical protein
MSVYFVYRSHYEGPSGKHVRRLDGDSVLGWFQAVWERAKQADDAWEWVKSEIGTSVYGFESIFEAARDKSLPPPTSDRKLKNDLDEHLYVEGEVLYRPHALQVLTNDDEIELAYYIFDDHFLAEHPGRAAYLLHEDWRLPVTGSERPYHPTIEARSIDPSGDDPGTIYLAFLTFYDSMNLDLHDGGPIRIDGGRLPQLADYLRESEPDGDWSFELRLLRSQLRPDDSGEDGLRRALERVTRLPVKQIGGTVMTSTLGLGTVEQAATELEGIVTKLPASQHGFDPSRSLVGSGGRIAQLCLHTGWEDGMYHQWFLFDDLWAGGHPDLADGVLRYAKRWDVLS